MKLDLAKAYDKVNCVFIRLSLIKMGMNLNIVNWVMGCIEFASFVVLINGSKLGYGMDRSCLCPAYNFSLNFLSIIWSEFLKLFSDLFLAICFLCGSSKLDSFG
jgi:hypothetical protein